VEIAARLPPIAMRRAALRQACASDRAHPLGLQARAELVEGRTKLVQL
jgi:hypothetical protein